MRQAQNAKRARGRGRKVVNQLSRTMDSSGPDVKVRGTASHIYEKYQTLARDANASGDRIMAENYLQHAEHYLRLINALQGAPARDSQAAANGARASEAPAGEEEAVTKANGHAAAAADAEAPAPATPTPSRGSGRGRRRANGGAQPAAVPPAADNGSPELPLVDQEVKTRRESARA